MGMHIPWELFKKLLQNQITEHDRELLSQWRDASEFNKTVYDEIAEDKTIKEALLNNTWENTTKQWNNLISVIKPADKLISFSRTRLYWLAGAAAGFLLLIGFSLFFWLHYEQLKRNGNGEFTYIYSPRGQRTQIILPDSTHVWLNSETSIRYPVAYNQKIREVTVEGEAFFHVKKNPEKPFLVHTSDLKIKVYGTSFNVKAYADERYIETTLIEGKLSVIPNKGKSDYDHEIFLKPKDKLTFKKGSFIDSLNINGSSNSKNGKPRMDSKDRPKLMLSRNINPDQENLWKEGKLLFNDEKFGDMAIKLERWYDVKIHFQDEEIKNYRFTGNLDKETINQAMEALKLSSQHSYKYEMVFRDIYLKSK